MAKNDTERTREELWSLLGDLPGRDRPVSARLLSVEETETYVVETLLLDLNGIEAVPALFTRPLGKPRRRPTLLYHHWHNGEHALGKRALLVGSSGESRPPYAELAARMGLNAFCIDAWNFGQRRGRSEHALFAEMLWKGRVLWGMMVFDAFKSVDYLVGRDDVDPARIATGGQSLGATTAWWLAALDERISAVWDLCCMTDFHALLDARGLNGHGIYYYVPRLLEHFTTARINALIAPRPHLSCNGDYDPLTPPAGLDRIDAELRKVYAEAGAPRNWRMLRRDVGHIETDEFRAEIVQFLQEHLCPDE